jgi:hypothetical protein
MPQTLRSASDEVYDPDIDDELDNCDRLRVHDHEMDDSKALATQRWAPIRSCDRAIAVFVDIHHSCCAVCSFARFPS